MNSKKTLKILILFFIIVNINSVKANEGIFYIDMDFIMNNSLAGKSITDQLKKINKSNLDSFKKTEKNLKLEESKIFAQKNVLEENEYEKKVNLFMKKVSNFKSLRNKKNSELTQKRIEAQNLLINALTPVLANYSKENSISIIIRKKNIIIGKSELDITKIVQKLIDKKLQNINIK